MTINNNFLLGVNYWPRRRGVNMWQEFHEKEIDSEFKQIHELGLNTVRVFPLWKDFQEVCEVKLEQGYRKRVALPERTVENAFSFPEMIDKEMIDRFDHVVKCAEKYNLKLIVALLTAWMSGNLFDLSWREGRNVFTDSFMLKYQMLYCRYFAKKYSDCDTILFWEYGNEQNCVNPCFSPEAAWTWLNTLANEIRINSPGKKLSAGMHALVVHPDENNSWGIADVADAVDMLTIHPYPAFTPGCFKERLTDMRANLHATAQGVFYGDLGKRPVLCEETGSLGNCVLSEESSADYLRLRLYSLYANGLMGCLWWCFGDFSKENELPYRDVQMENDGLGLTAVDGRIKPVGTEMKRFGETMNKLDIKLTEPERRTAIIVSDSCEDWETYFTAYSLCKQAGIEACFVMPDENLKDYDLLICPSISGFSYYNVPNWKNVLKRVESGATLYLSSDGASLMFLDGVFGITEADRLPWPTKEKSIYIENFADSPTFSFAVKQAWFHEIRKTSAHIIGFWEDGSSAILQNIYGAGKAIFCAAGLEKYLSTLNYALTEYPAYKFYEYLRDLSGVSQTVMFSDPNTEKTFHRISEEEGVLILINHNRKDITEKLLCTETPDEISCISGGCSSVKKMGTGDIEITLPPLQADIFKLKWNLKKR